MTEPARPSPSALRALPGRARPRPTSAWSPRCSAAATGTPGPGDDGAVLPDGAGRVVVGGEAILPAFVAADPYGAGHRGGARQRQRPGRHGRASAGPRSTPSSAPRTSPGRCCAGMRWAAELLRRPGRRRAPHPHATGRRRCRRSASAGPTRVLSATARRGRAGAACSAAASTGAMRPDFLFFPSFDERGDRLAGDVRLLADARRRRAPRWPPRTSAWPGWSARWPCCWSPAGSGVAVDLDALPVPARRAARRLAGLLPVLRVPAVRCPPERVDDCLAGVPRARPDRASRWACSTTPAAAAVRLGDARPRSSTSTGRASPTCAAERHRRPGSIAIRWCGTPRWSAGSPTRRPAQPHEERDVAAAGSGPSIRSPPRSRGGAPPRSRTSGPPRPACGGLGQHRQPVALPEPGLRRAGRAGPCPPARPSTARARARSPGRRRARRGRRRRTAPAPRRTPRAGCGGARRARPASRTRPAARAAARCAGQRADEREETDVRHGCSPVRALERAHARAGLAARAAGGDARRTTCPRATRYGTTWR